MKAAIHSPKTSGILMRSSATRVASNASLCDITLCDRSGFDSLT
ncbi:hypothetical protein BSU04_29265 [Caballeronia sordidicola]|uniref:Uncharacterized protein n=1 Tax=Caballeronia sordidicola TaxID=196367 RepID=A0A226WUX4_CABSO|nr:hypothetical protein BSU04_29265 [Caballeronia sordidicola]